LHQIAVGMQIKIYTLLFFIISSVLVWAKPYTVVIDAGHGGKDAGAIGNYCSTYEKNLNLEVSLRLASKLRTAYPEMNVILTRSGDVFLPLQERADIVNKNNADLFICIHTNAADSHSAHGAETFILGTDRMEDNLDVAMRENAVMKMEKDYQTTYQGFDPNSVDSYIMFELMQNQYMDQSLQFASLVQNRLVSDVKRDDRGVRQAAFWVLLKSACPSILVEMGFVSNKEEEQYLSSDQGKREVTEAIFLAFVKYYGNISGKKPILEENTPSVSVPTETPPVKSVKETEKKGKDSMVVANKDTVAKTIQKEGSELEQQKQKTQEKEVPVSTQSASELYGVQLFACVKELAENDPEFKGLKGCIYLRRNQWYKYVYGSFPTQEEAEKLCQELQGKFPGCFVVKIK